MGLWGDGTLYRWDSKLIKVFLESILLKFDLFHPIDLAFSLWWIHSVETSTSTQGTRYKQKYVFILLFEIVNIGMFISRELIRWFHGTCPTEPSRWPQPYVNISIWHVASLSIYYIFKKYKEKQNMWVIFSLISYYKDNILNILGKY